MESVKLTLCCDLCNETFANYPGTVLSLCTNLSKVFVKVRPHLEYANTVWAPRRICNIEKNENVQKGY